MTKNSEKMDVVKALIESGLHPNEVSVYLALLKSGQSGTTVLARTTGLHGQLIYRALDTLCEKGYVAKTKINSRHKYTANAPSRILLDLKQRENKLDEAIKYLEAQHTDPITDQIVVTQGRTLFIERELELIRKAPKGSEILVIGGEGDNYAEILSEKMNEYNYLRTKRNITLRYIASDSQRAGLPEADMPLAKVRFLPHEFRGDVNIGIYPGTFGMYVFSEPPSSIYVQNEKIANNYVQFFEALWKMAT